MNKMILLVLGYLLYPENYTKKQLEKNYRAATWSAAYAVRGSAEYITYYAAYCACAYSGAVYAVRVEYWLKRYFDITGENRQDYIDTIHKDNK